MLTLILSSAFVIQYASNTSDQENVAPALYFNVRVYQYGGTTPQSGARVDYKQNGATVESGTTGNDGICYKNLNSGTYDVYVVYPDRPNDSSSGSLIGHYHDGDETVNVTLTIFY